MDRRTPSSARPPVGNVVVYDETDDFIVKDVGGPNARKDFHYNEGEELLHQPKAIYLATARRRKMVDMPIREGDIFCYTATHSHSPQRRANTVGLVDGAQTATQEMDGFLWFCENCGSKLYEEYHCKQYRGAVSTYAFLIDSMANAEHCTCKKCGTVMERLCKAASIKKQIDFPDNLIRHCLPITQKRTIFSSKRAVAISKSVKYRILTCCNPNIAYPISIMVNVLLFALEISSLTYGRRGISAFQERGLQDRAGWDSAGTRVSMFTSFADPRMMETARFTWWYRATHHLRNWG